uniref:Uncharacterized protein n=1 Tax=Romanomermis culicivorax TaxID=13658 RepID=A0A915KX80_ROMCU
MKNEKDPVRDPKFLKFPNFQKYAIPKLLNDRRPVEDCRLIERRNPFLRYVKRFATSRKVENLGRKMGNFAGKFEKSQI